MNECNNNRGIKTSKRHHFSNKLTTKCEPVPVDATFCITSSFCRCRLAVRRADLRQPKHRLHDICHTWSCSQVSAMRASWCNSCQKKRTWKCGSRIETGTICWRISFFYLCDCWLTSGLFPSYSSSFLAPQHHFLPGRGSDSSFLCPGEEGGASGQVLGRRWGVKVDCAVLLYYQQPKTVFSISSSTIILIIF